MNISDRDRRALSGLAVAVLLLIIWRWSSSPSTDTIAAGPVASDSIAMSERRLDRLRQVAGAVPGKEDIFQQVSAELDRRERGILQADSAQQAQAQIMQILNRVARGQQERIDFKNVELGQVRPFGDQYGEVLVSVSFDTGIEQLLNFLADLTSQKELVATNELRVGMAQMKQKSVPVRLTVSGIVRRNLIPTTKKAAAF